MTKETLEKANDLANKLEECKKNLKKVGYTQCESVVIRESYLRCNGIEDGMTQMMFISASVDLINEV